MRSRQMTRALRESIVNRALHLKFGNRHKELKDLEVYIADAVYQYLYKEDVLSIAQALAVTLQEQTGLSQPALPCVFLRHGNSAAATQLPLRDFRPQISETCSISTNDLPPLVLADFEYWLEATKSLSGARQVLRWELERLLMSVNSTKQLLELMPEAEAWLPTTRKCTNVPAADLAVKLREMS